MKHYAALYSRLVIINALLLAGIGVTQRMTLAAGPETAVAAEAANVVEKSEIVARLVPDQPTIMLGEPTSLSFVVENHSQQDLWVIVGGDYLNRLGRPSSFKVAVNDADGKPVPQPNAGISMGGMVSSQKLTAHGSYSFRLFLPHWATFQRPGDYTIVARRTLSIGRETKESWTNPQKIEAQASTTLEVTPTDHKRMGELIDGLGSLLLQQDWGKSRDAARSLAAIDDERVIPYFVKSFHTNQYERKIEALTALARFDTDAAFAVLKQGLETTGQDIGYTTTPQGAAESAAQIRVAAAYALSKSKRPEAMPLLLASRHDESADVRLTILQTATQLPPATARPILEEMRTDEDKRVQSEAERYLKQLQETGAIVIRPLVAIPKN